MTSKDKIDTENLVRRFLAEADENYAEAIDADRRRRHAAHAAAGRAGLWAGFSRDREFAAGLAARKDALGQEIELLESDAFSASIETIRKLGVSINAGEARVIGNVSAPTAFRGRADLLDKEGKIVATSPIDALGNFVVTAPAGIGDTTLEIRDEHNHLTVVDGQPIKLDGVKTVGRTFSVSPAGDVAPVAPPPPASATMPNLKDTTAAAAKSALAKLGAFNISTDERFDAKAKKGRVVDQAPSAGKPINDGDIVRLTISLGSEVRKKMPNLRGKTVAEARKALEGFQMRSLMFAEVRDPKRAGAVVTQEPRSGAQVGRETEIVLTIAVADRRMPDVTGKSLEDATKHLEPDFTDRVKVVGEALPEVPGTVLRHIPPPGELIVDGKVELVVARKGKEPGTAAKRVVPNLKGMTRTRALKELEKIGLTKPVFDGVAARKRGARVIDQAPKAGTVLKGKQNVSLEFGVMR